MQMHKVSKFSLCVFDKMDEVIDDIISLQSSYDDIQAYIDPVVQMPNTVSKDFTQFRPFSRWHCRLWLIQITESQKVSGKLSE